MIEHNVNGLLVSPIEDVEGPELLIRLIENPDLRKNISNQSVTIRDKYSINNIMKMWDQILENKSMCGILGNFGYFDRSDFLEQEKYISDRMLRRGQITKPF